MSKLQNINRVINTHMIFCDTNQNFDYKVKLTNMF